MHVLPQNAVQAKQQLHAAHDSQQVVLAVVFGSTPRAKQIAALAAVRAEGQDERDVYCQADAHLLGGDPLLSALVGAAQRGAEVVFLTLTFEVAKQLEGADALDGSAHEEGFALALAGQAE
jgi:hypothetical protein